MNKCGLMATGMVCATALVISAMLARAGSLTPPPGPVAPTGPTIIDQLPFTINAPGAYILTSNLTAPVDVAGIEIAASNVTIDLRGFTLAGGGTGVIDPPGIRSNVNVENISVIGGAVRDWGGIGIDLALAQGCLIRDMRIHSNRNTGLRVGVASTIQGVSAFDNSLHGIEVEATSVVTGCSAKNNVAVGIVLGNDSTASHCSSSDNGDDGFFGSFGVTIDACAAQLNQDDGIRVSTGSTVRNCTSRANGCDGIEVVADCLVLGNNCASNGQDPQLVGAGILASSTRNRIESNHLANNFHGIRLEQSESYIADNTVIGSASLNYVLAPRNLNNILLCEAHDSFNVPASIKLGGTIVASLDNQEGIDGNDLVSVDLNGHAMIGTGVQNIDAPGVVAGLVCNGFIDGWGNSGATGFKIANRVISTNNQSMGLQEFGRGLATECYVSGNQSTGINASLVQTCLAFDGRGIGLQGSLAVDSWSSFNDFDGFGGTLVATSVALSNGRDGIAAGVVTNSSASSNTDDGISAPGGLVRGNRSRGNGTNIDAPLGTVVENH